MGLVPQDQKGRLNFHASWAQRVMLKVRPLQEHEDWEDRDRQKVDMACMYGGAYGAYPKGKEP